MKYEYKYIDQKQDESDQEFLKRVNDLGRLGYKYISESASDDGTARVLFEKQLENE